MSFRCQTCGASQPSGTKPTKMVTKVRKIVFAVRVSNDGREGNSRERTETVEEKLVCAVCAQKSGGPEIVEWR